MPGMGELIIILLIVLVVFGANKLPGIGDALGRSIKNFKRASKVEDDDKDKDKDKDTDTKDDKKSDQAARGQARQAARQVDRRGGWGVGRGRCSAQEEVRHGRLVRGLLALVLI